MIVGLYGKNIDEQKYPIISDVLKVFAKLEVSLWMHQSLVKEVQHIIEKIPELKVLNSSNSLNEIDFMISIGGDGTFLDAFTYLKRKDIPLIGINTGRLGFLADISPEAVEEAINMLKQGRYKIEKRSVVKANLSKDQGLSFPYAINDLTVHKRDSSSMISIQTYINDEFLTTYWADGLVISTPSGSTAYSMSAGGPIVTPESKSFILTPIANHNLTVRPLVIPDDSTLVLRIEAREKKYLLSLDSRSYVIEEPLEISITKDEKSMSVVKFNNMSYYNTLRNKLLWGIDKRN